ncbi:MAG: glycosyltransferase family 2 protein, partial [Rhizobiaceae bacterium]
MAYRLVEFELSRPLPAIELTPKEDGVGLIGRWHDQLIGFEMIAAAPGSTLSAEEIRTLADRHFASRVLIAMMEAELVPGRLTAAPLPSLSIAICTKDRAERLSRLLRSLEAVRNHSPFGPVEIVVVDNASTDSATREAVESFNDIRYVFEPKAGLDFARNAALHAAAGALIAYLDDDVVVDRNWLMGLAKACGDNPGAGGFTGLVLPYRLDTEAQIYFERRGGFGRGFYRNEFRGSRFDNPL